MSFQNERGFTLVELAIALMVIGLLIGGVLKGQELIENARITAVMRQIKSYDAATMIFRNTYGALPGDIKRPNRIPNCTDDMCIEAGNGDGKIERNTAEMYNYFPHLTKAGMIQGPEGGTQEEWDALSISAMEVTGDTTNISPVMPIDTIQLVRVYWLTGNPSVFTASHFYDLYTMTGRQAYSLDQKLDDGDGSKGDVQMEDGEYCLTSEEPYYDLENGMCGLIIRTGF